MAAKKADKVMSETFQDPCCVPSTSTPLGAQSDPLFLLAALITESAAGLLENRRLLSANSQFLFSAQHNPGSQGAPLNQMPTSHTRPSRPAGAGVIPSDGSEHLIGAGFCVGEGAQGASHGR